MEKFSEAHKAVIGGDPSADIFNGGFTSDAVNMALYERATFMLKTKATTGVGTVKLEACSKADGTGAETIPFTYEEIDAAGTPVDAISAEKSAAKDTGFDTATAKTMLYLIAVPAKITLPDGKGFVRLKAAEKVDAAVVGNCDILLDLPVYKSCSLHSAVS